MSSADPHRDLLCIDLGTTNMRVWRIDSRGNILKQVRAQAGVRDTARDGHSNLLRQTLKRLIAELMELPGRESPARIVAAGMITSSLGLVEVPQVHAPAGIADVARGVEIHRFPDISELPFHLIPGIRTNWRDPQPEDVDQTDMMRGEETLCLGMIEAGFVSPPAMVLNLGSHWKLFELSEDGKLVSASSTLSGELLHATMTQTILASAMPAERPKSLDELWLFRGIEQQRRTGLSHALFRIRVLQLRKAATTEQLYAYLSGCFIASDMDAWIRSGELSRESKVYLCGSAGIATAWSATLKQQFIDNQVITETQVEHSTLTGQLRIIGARK